MADDKKTSDEDAAGALDGTEIVRITQMVSGVLTSVRTTLANVVALAGTPSDPTKVAIHNISGAYTYVPADAGKVVRHNDATATTATIDTNAHQAFALTQVVTMRQVGAGQLTISPAAGVTLNVPTGFTAKTRAQGSTIMAHYISADQWDLSGDLST